jgi:hypothetical protein
MVSVVGILPMPVSVALAGTDVSNNDCCTKRGFIPLTCSDGSIYWHLCFYCANVVKTIISPEAVLASSDVFYSWMQTGFKDGQPGTIRFDCADGLLTINITLDCLKGLYYCHADVYTVDPTPDTNLIPNTLTLPIVSQVATTNPPSSLRCPSCYTPVLKSKQLELDLWLLCLGSPGIYQLDVLPGNMTGIPVDFDHHPFWLIDFKAQAQIQKQAAQLLAVRTPERKRCFYMDYRFMQASTADFSKRDKSKDHVVHSHNGFTSYLLIVDKASRYIWVFLTMSKDPLLDIEAEFMKQNSHEDGRCVQTDQGGELACSQAFQDMLLREHHYTLKPTSSDNPSQNSAAEIYNDKFGVKKRTLLYSSGLLAKFWSAALCHTVYLYNRLVHSETKKTPFVGYYRLKPDLFVLKVFGSQVCVKWAGNRVGKLDHINFTGVFLGY